MIGFDMASVSAQIDKAVKSIQDSDSGILKNLRAGLTRAAAVIVRDAKKNIRINKSVITGKLLNSVTFWINEELTNEKGVQVFVGSNVEYAKYVEFGTSRAGEKPYLRPAIESNRPEVKRILSEFLAKAEKVQEEKPEGGE